MTGNVIPLMERRNGSLFANKKSERRLKRIRFVAKNGRNARVSHLPERLC